MSKPSAEPVARPTICVIGDVMLDRYYWGRIERLSPEAPVPILSIDRVTDHPGGAANVALNCQALGAEVTLMGIVGPDGEAAILAAALGGAGIRCELRQGAERSILKMRMISAARHLFRADLERAIAPQVAEALAADFAPQAASYDVVVLSDYDKGTLADPASLIATCRAAGIPVCVDPKTIPFSRYAGATMLKPNSREFEQATGCAVGSAGFRAAAERLTAGLDLAALMVTAGAEGVHLFRRDCGYRHFAAHSVPAVDVTGAGDAAMAGFAVALGRGEPLETAAQRANDVASLAVSRLGTVVVSTQDVERHYP